MNTVLDGGMPDCAAFPERDLLIFELLYGCGLRNSELTGMNPDDLRSSEGVHPGSQERTKAAYVPFGDSVRTALAAYLPERQKLLAAGKKPAPGAADQPCAADG